MTPTQLSNQELIEKCEESLSEIIGDFDDLKQIKHWHLVKDILSRFEQAQKENEQLKEDLKCDVKLCHTDICACHGTGNILVVLKSVREDHSRLQDTINRLKDSIKRQRGDNQLDQIEGKDF